MSDGNRLSRKIKREVKSGRQNRDFEKVRRIVEA